jgi:4-amino-4-deoxy-L-arabinose transferase-like glycosyltransferase
MFGRLHRRGGHYLLLGGLSALLFFTNLGGASLWDLDEGRNAVATFEMLESQNYIVPTFNGLLRVDKPALLYWLQLGAYQAFGVCEFSARLPSAVAALLTVLLGYELGRAMFGRATGLLTGVVAASTPMLCGAARFANPDALLNLFTVLTLTLCWLGRARSGVRWFLGIGAAAGLGVLAKGPVGFVLPATVIGVYLLWQRQSQLLLDRRWALAVLVMLLVALPWYIRVTVETRGNFLHGFLLRHNVERFQSAMENHHGSLLYYPLVLLVGLAPWTIFAGPALWFGAWSALREPRPRLRPWWQSATEGERRLAAYRLLWCWLLTYLIFFSVAATKLPNYVLPVVVPAAVLLARFLERWRLAQVRLPNWIVTSGLTCLALIGAALSAGLVIASGYWDLPILRGRVFPGLEGWALLGLFPIAGALLGSWCWRRQRRTGLIVCLTGSAVLLLAPLAAYGSVVFNDCKAPRPLVEQAGALRRQDDIRIGCWNLEHLPSLNFYVQRDVIHLRDETEAVAFLSYPTPVYLFVSAADWRRLEGRVTVPFRVVGRQREMYRHCEVLVLTNR